MSEMLSTTQRPNSLYPSYHAIPFIVNVPYEPTDMNSTRYVRNALTVGSSKYPCKQKIPQIASKESVKRPNDDHSAPALNFCPADANSSCCCRSSSSAVKPLCSILLAFFSRVYPVVSFNLPVVSLAGKSPSKLPCAPPQQQALHQHNPQSRDPSTPSRHVHMRSSFWLPFR